MGTLAIGKVSFGTTGGSASSWMFDHAYLVWMPSEDKSTWVVIEADGNLYVSTKPWVSANGTSRDESEINYFITGISDQQWSTIVTAGLNYNDVGYYYEAASTDTPSLNCWSVVDSLLSAIGLDLQMNGNYNTNSGTNNL